MKKLCLIIFCLMGHLIVAYGQEEPKPSVKLSRARIEELGVQVVNQFLVTIKNLTNCSGMLTSGSLELFAPNAKIEVSSKKTNQIRTFTPGEYFRAIRALRCATNSVYSSMNFDYQPVSTKDAVISSYNGTSVVTFDVKQKFKGISGSNKAVYSDITMKVITIIIQRDSAGALHPQILNIAVENTKPAL